MHVLIVPSWYPNTYLPLYGIYVKEQAKALKAAGIRTGVISIEEINLLQILKHRKLDFFTTSYTDGGIVTYAAQYPVPPKCHGLRRTYKKKVFKKLFEEYTKRYGRPDILHLHTFIVGELALWVREEYGIPYVVTEHFTGFARETIRTADMQRAMHIYRNAAHRIAVSHEFCSLLKRKTGFDFQYIPNVVDTDFFVPGNRAEKRGLFTFINIAYLEKKKNQGLLIRAFAKIAKSDPDVRLLIVGCGPERKMLEALIRDLGVEGRVKMEGCADRKRVRELLQRSDVFVLSSEHETFGVVVIEALACGLPVIATPSGGPETILTEPGLGTLCDMDEGALAAEMLRMKNEIGTYDPHRIRAYAEANFSPKRVGESLEKLYRRILEKVEK